MDSFIKTLCTCLFIFVMTVTVPPVIEFIKTVSEKNGDMGTASYYPITETEFGYSLSYNLDGGTVDNPTYYSLYSPTFTLNNPTKTGYEFVGWTGSNGDTPQLTVTICTGSAGDLEFTANYKMNYFIELNDNILEWYIGEDVNDYEFYVNGTYLEHIKGIYSLDITSLNEYFNPGPNTLMVKFGTHMVSTSYMYFPSESFDNLTLDCHFSLRSDGYRISCVDNDITMIELGYSFDGNCNYSYFNGGIRYPNNQNEYFDFFLKYICCYEISTNYFSVSLNNLTILEFLEMINNGFENDIYSTSIEIHNNLIFTFADGNETQYIANKITLNINYHDMYKETLFYDGATVNVSNFASSNRCYAYHAYRESDINYYEVTLELIDINDVVYSIGYKQNLIDNSITGIIGTKDESGGYTTYYTDLEEFSLLLSSQKFYLNTSTYFKIENVTELLLNILESSIEYRNNYEIGINNNSDEWGDEVVTLESINITNNIKAYNVDDTEILFDFNILLDCKTSGNILKLAAK